MISLRLLQGRWHSTLFRNVTRVKALTTAASHDSGPEPSALEPQSEKVKPSEEELSGAEPWMVVELERYYQGRRRLADMMGVPPHKFTDEDVEDALRYLLPSRLFARDAQPSMKHPFKIFPERKEALFDKSRRPLDAGFYTGSPAYHSLVYQIFEQGGKLSLPLEPEKEVSELPAIVKELEDRIAASSGQSSTTEEVNTTEEVRKEEELFPSPVATEVQEEEGLSPSPVATEVQEEEGLSPSPVETEVQEEEGLSPSPAEVQEEEGLSPSPVTAEVQEEEGLSPSPVTTEVQENVQQDLPKTWIKKEAMENIIAEELSDKQYSDLIRRLSALSSHPKSSTISSFLDKYRQPVFSYRSVSHTPSPSVDGSVQAVGKRKTAMAVVTLRPGSGVVSVNKKTFVDYFPRAEDRHQVLYPLQVTELLGKYDVTVTVQGGGASGQSGAVRLGISKALLGFPGDHSDVLESEGLLIRDPRMVERKKPGQKKARKKFAWVKR